MVEALLVVAMLLAIGAFGAVKVVPWEQLLSFGKALMLGSAMFGIPLEALYFTALGIALTWSEKRPHGWYWRPFMHHPLLSARQKIWVLPWFFTGALAFVGIVLGIAITVLGMIAAATQSR